MKIGNYDVQFKGLGLPSITNLDKKLPDSRNIMKTILKKQLSRQNENIKKWRDGISAAESTTRPSRLTLVRIFADIVIDAHLTTVMQTRNINVQSLPFKIVDQNDNELKDLQENTFNKEWFYDVIFYLMEAKYYGYSLIQLGPIVNDAFEWATLVPREHVIPERHEFIVNISDSEGVDFTKPPWSDWTIWADDGSLGLLNKAAPLAIWKKTVFGAWSEFNEVFGNPLVIGRTDIQDPDKRANMEGMLDSLIDASWGVFSDDDQLEVISGIKVGGHNTFRDELKMINEELSKLFLGQTMTTEDGASRSQSEVHERVMNTYLEADMRYIWSKVNNLVMPILVKHGLAPEGTEFRFSTEKKLSLEDKQSLLVSLLPFYNIPPAWINENFDIPVEEGAGLPQPNQDGSFGEVNNKLSTIMNDVNRLYNEAYEHAHKHNH